MAGMKGWNPSHCTRCTGPEQGPWVLAEARSLGSPALRPAGGADESEEPEVGILRLTLCTASSGCSGAVRRHAEPGFHTALFVCIVCMPVGQRRAPCIR